MQLEIGISTNRYLPASGTAGLARSLVSGNKRVPCPPPMITDNTLLVLIDCRPVCDPATFGCSASLCIPDRSILRPPKIASSFGVHEARDPGRGCVEDQTQRPRSPFGIPRIFTL